MPRGLGRLRCLNRAVDWPEYAGYTGEPPGFPAVAPPEGTDYEQGTGMRHLNIAALACLAVLFAGAAPAQSTDTAAERGRLADERIRLEAERRQREDQERQAQEAATPPAEPEVQVAATRVEESPSLPAPQPVEETPSAPAAQPVEQPAPAAAQPARPVQSPAPGGSVELSDGLEQLQRLGELRDAGYVTDEEFERLKAKILDSLL